MLNSTREATTGKEQFEIANLIIIRTTYADLIRHEISRRSDIVSRTIGFLVDSTRDWITSPVTRGRQSSPSVVPHT